MTQLYPAVLDPRTLSRQVWDASTARRIPGVGRALDLICGLMSQMPLDQYAGIMPLPRPTLLEQPDPDMDLATFVAVQVEDWLLHGNAAHLITARYRDSGWPAAAKWFPASSWHVDMESGRKRWWLNGREVADGDVVHVQNGANPRTPWVGMGVVEKYVLELDRIATQTERERVDTRDGQVPSVAVIVPQKEPEQTDLDDAAERWEQKFGPNADRGRQPVFLPNGTQVVPLGWNPSDAQAAELRKLALQDTANMFNLDGYWLGAATSSHTYRSPGPLFLGLIRTTLGRIITPFEQTWSAFWLPRGRRVTFDREAIQADDFGSMVTTLTKATGRPVMVLNEARARLKLAPVAGGDEFPAAPAEPDEEPDEQDDEQDELDQEGATA